MEFWQSKKGLYSLEIIISIAFFTLMATGVFVLLGSSIAESSGLIQRARVRALLTEGIAAAESIANQDWDLFVSGVYGLSFDGSIWAFNGSEDTTAGNFVRSVTVVNSGDNLAEVTVNVTWVFVGRLLAMSSGTMLTNWSNLEVWGDWGNPIVVGSLDIGPQGKATSLGKNGEIVYLTAEASSGAVPTFFTINISDVTEPFIVDSIITSDNLQDLVYIPDSNLVYAVGDNDDAELRIFGITDPSKIQLAGDDELEDDGMSVFLDGTTLAVGTKNEVVLFDVSNPASPVYLSTYVVGEHVHDLVIAGDYLYATSHTDNQELLILSIADLNEPVLVGGVDTAGKTDGITVAVNGNDLYLGLKKNSGSNPELYHYDRTDPVNLIEIESFDIAGEVNGIVTAGQYVFLASGANNLEFQVYELRDGTLSFVTGLNMAQKATGIIFDDNTIFLSIRSNDAFQIIQSSP